jgi:succinate dehydrogenase/fumarate reductase flavoprotein subunit
MAEVMTRPGIIRTDVVVIGSGGAGLCAAAAARAAGARVTLLTKGKAGVANCTAWAGGGLTVSPPADVEWEEGHEVGETETLLTPEEHFRLSLDTGRGLNDPELLREMCDSGPSALRELERDYGVLFDWNARGCSVRGFGREPLLGGVGLTTPLLAHLRQAGVEVVEGVVAREILFGSSGEVCGVAAVDVDGSACGPETPEDGRSLAWRLVRAGAVIVATGGGGAIYGRTDNPPRLTGDGYRLLAAAGAILEDMEFVQFYPIGVAEPGLPARLLHAGFIGLIPLLDENGCDPLAGKWSEWGIGSGEEANLYARDLVAVALARHIDAGHEIYLHTEKLPGAKVPPGYLELARGAFPRSFDPFIRPVRVAPTQHYFCGGAVITRRGEVLGTRGGPEGRDRRPVTGLFACGEVTAGVDGANRVGGNALTNIVVFGLAAGRAAAREALSRGTGVSAGGDALPSTFGSQATRSLVFSPNGPSPASLRVELQGLCDEGLGPVRSAKKLEDVLAGLSDLGRRLAGVGVRSRSDLLLALEFDSAVATAVYVAKAALARTESRGAHFRQDYPVEDPAWSGRHVSLR